MKATIILLLSCLCLRGADDIKATTVVSTNVQTGLVNTQEFFTRAGQTNLLCSTTSRNGAVRSRLYSFYHEGKHAADHLTVAALGYSRLGTYNGFNLAMTSRSNALSEVILRDPYGQVLDMFLSTNGVLAPVPASELRAYISKPAALELDAEKPSAK